MTLEEFLNSPQEEQDKIVKTFFSRKRILERVEYIKQEQETLRLDMLKVQADCQHPLLHIKEVRDEDDYGKMLDSGYTNYACPDCEKKWSVEW